MENSRIILLVDNIDNDVIAVVRTSLTDEEAKKAIIETKHNTGHGYTASDLIEAIGQEVEFNALYV